MRKNLKFVLAAASLLAALGLASCSNNDDSDSKTATTTSVTTKTVKTQTFKIGNDEYSYTTTDGKADTKKGVTVSDDGSITITKDDSSSVKVSKDGKTLTYTDKDGKTYTGTLSADSSSPTTLTGEGGATVTATSETETKTALSGNKYYNSIIKYENTEKYSADINVLTFADSKSEVTMSQVKSKVKTGTIKENNELHTRSATYLVSDSKLTLKTDEGDLDFTISSDGKTISDSENGKWTLFSGDVYAMTYAIPGKNPEAAVIILGSDGKGSNISYRYENGQQESKKYDFTYTISGKTATFTVPGLGEQSGTFSENNKELKMTIKGNELTYKKL